MDTQEKEAWPLPDVTLVDKPFGTPHRIKDWSYKLAVNAVVSNICRDLFVSIVSA